MDLQNIFGLLKKLFISGSTNFLRLCSIYSCCSFLSNFTLILLYFICYCIECFGTDIFMSKIKSIKFLIFSCYLLTCEGIRLSSLAARSEEKLLNSQPVIIYALFTWFLFYFPSTVTDLSSQLLTDRPRTFFQILHQKDLFPSQEIKNIALKADRMLTFVPIVFFLLRFCGTLRCILCLYTDAGNSPRWWSKMLLYLQVSFLS